MNKGSLIPVLPDPHAPIAIVFLQAINEPDLFPQFNDPKRKINLTDNIFIYFLNHIDFQKYLSPNLS